MDETLSPETSGGVVRALETLRHALADPLSAAALKLELVERRLASVSPGGPALAERLRGAKSDLGAAGRLIDLLPHLASIAGEEPSETSIDDLCRLAGVPLEEEAVPRPRLPLRRLATLDALRALVRCLRPHDPGGPSPRASVETRADRLSLRIEAPGSFDADPERLFHLPRGGERAEGLFLARAGVESDGGRLELGQRDGLLVALVSWPLPGPSRRTGTPA